MGRSDKTPKAPKTHKAPKAAKAPKAESDESSVTTKKSVSKSQKAGLTFPVSRFNRYLKTKSGVKRIGGSAPVYLAAVVEYITSEIMEVSGNSTKQTNRKTINPEDLSSAIRGDPDLQKLFSGHSLCVGDKIVKVSESIQYKPTQKS